MRESVCLFLCTTPLELRCCHACILCRRRNAADVGTAQRSSCDAARAGGDRNLLPARRAEIRRRLRKPYLAAEGCRRGLRASRAFRRPAHRPARHRSARFARPSGMLAAVWRTDR